MAGLGLLLAVAAVVAVVDVIAVRAFRLQPPQRWRFQWLLWWVPLLVMLVVFAIWARPLALILGAAIAVLMIVRSRNPDRFP
jgi:hypothetical protein